MALLKSAQPLYQPLTHPPLNPSREEIRLISLHPPLESDLTLRCTFLPITFLSDAGLAIKPPPYETLSYVWGEPDFSDSVIVNNQLLHITPSLATILFSLRHETEPRLLWIDAICINQNDLVERAQQVKLMRKVYSSCRRVLAWVGPTQVKDRRGCSEYLDVRPEQWSRTGEQPEPLPNGQPECPEEQQRQRFTAQQQKVVAAMQLLQKIADRDSHTIRSYEENFARANRRRRSHIRRRSLDRETPAQEAPSTATKKMQLTHDRNVLGELLTRPTFWTRVWVVQEISCAPQVTLICNEAELEWSCISDFLKDEPYFDAFHDVQSSHDSYNRAQKRFRRVFANVKVIEDQRRTMLGPAIESASNTLLDVLTRFRNKQAVDARDKIYALLGLVSQRHDVNVDYTKTVERLYQEVTLTLIRISGNLDILCQNPFESRQQLDDTKEPQRNSVPASGRSHETMPSWAAQFHLQSHECLPVMFAQRNIFNAGLQSESVKYRLTGRHKNVLALRGTIIDRIGSTFLDLQPDVNLPSTDWSEQAKSKLISILQHPRLHSGHGHGYSAPHILRSISTTRTPPPTASTTPAELLEHPEPPIRALWRTLAKDCTAPPRMRRLTTKEIDALDTINTPGVKAGKMPLTCNTVDASDTPDDSVEDSGENGTTLKPTSLPRETRKDFVFTVSVNGLYLLTRRIVEAGDVIAVLDSGKVPVVLRSVEGGGAGGEVGQAYRFVGVAYVHGIMDGEVEEAVASGCLQKEEVMLA